MLQGNKHESAAETGHLRVDLYPQHPSFADDIHLDPISPGRIKRFANTDERSRTCHDLIPDRDEVRRIRRWMIRRVRSAGQLFQPIRLFLTNASKLGQPAQLLRRIPRLVIVNDGRLVDMLGRRKAVDGTADRGELLVRFDEAVSSRALHCSMKLMKLKATGLRLAEISESPFLHLRGGTRGYR